MIAKAILVFWAQAVLAQSALSYYIGSPLVPSVGLAAPYGLAYDGLPGSFAYNGLPGPFAYDGLPGPFSYDGRAGWGGRDLFYDGIYPAAYPVLDFTPTSGGGLPVVSTSARGPVGIAVDSENFYEGRLAVVGELPFVGTVGFEGVAPTAGAGVVNHACGNGINAMISEPAACAGPGHGYRGWC